MTDTSPNDTPRDAPEAGQTPAAFRQLAIQGAAVFAVLSVAWPYYGLRGEALPWPATAFVIGGMGFVLAFLTRQPRWWQLIHTGFAPLAWAVSLLSIPPGWFLAAFVLSLLFYRGAVTGQIPLYLSNRVTAEALIELLGERPASRFADLGAGIGSTIAPLSRALPASTFTGVENAPASWAIGWLRLRNTPNVKWQMGSLWKLGLGEFDVVYAFLSPAPMPGLWQKALQEMRPGSLLISNSFPVPDIDPEDILQIADARQTRLYCYRIPAATKNT